MDREMGQQGQCRRSHLPVQLFAGSHLAESLFRGIGTAAYSKAGFSVKVVMEQRDYAFFMPFHCLVGKSWNYIAAAIQSARLVIGNDSGPAHLSGTIGTPTIAIQGPTTERIFRHIPEVVSYRKKALGCAGCHFLPEKEFRASCDSGCHELYRTFPEEVATYALSMLNPQQEAAEQHEPGNRHERFGRSGLDIARDVASKWDTGITYVEIGVGEGATLTAIASALQASRKKWRAIGIELPNGYSFNMGATERLALERGLKLNFITPNCSIVHPPWNEVTVYFKDSQSFLTEHWQEQIHLALIDGCQVNPVPRSISSRWKRGWFQRSVMMFHDISPEQRGHAQPHCADGIDVWGACYDLGAANRKTQGLEAWRDHDTRTKPRAAGTWAFSKRKSDGRLSPADP